LSSYIFNQYQLAAWVGLGKPKAQLCLCLKLRSVNHALPPWALVGNSEDRSLAWHRAAIWPYYRSSGGYSWQDTQPDPMQLAHPTPIRLTPSLLQWLDSWRGDQMSRATAIRFLLQQSMDLHRDGILPSTQR
jgi:hypothetical protein